MSAVQPWNEPHPDACPFHLGNRTGYIRRGCRCDWCRWANSAYMAFHRAQAHMPERPDPPEQLQLWVEP